MTSRSSRHKPIWIVNAVVVALFGGGCARHRATLAPSETIIVKVQDDPQGKPGTMLVVDSQVAPDKPMPVRPRAMNPAVVTVGPGETVRSLPPLAPPTPMLNPVSKPVDPPAARPMMPILIPAEVPEPAGAPIRPVTIQVAPEGIVAVRAEVPSTRVVSLPGMPTTGAETMTLTSSADSRFARAANYSWIVGELEYLRSRNVWRVRFTTPGEADAIGGTVTLAGAESLMDGMTAGTVVRIEGSLVDPTSKESSPKFQLRTIRKENLR